MPKASRTVWTAPVRAVLPAAGRGTRMAALAAGRAKELLPVAGRPLLAHALADLEQSGITSSLLIVSPQKREIAATFGARFGTMTLEYAVQNEPLGLADALALAEPFVAGAPFVCWLPDNLWIGRRPATAQLIEGMRHAALATPATACHGVALIERSLDGFDATSVGAAGFVVTAPAPADAPNLEITRVFAKGERPALSGTTFLKGFPLDLWQPDLFDRVRHLRATTTTGELDDTPLLQQLAREGALRGVVLREGTLHDCGVPRGYRAACSALAST